MAKPLQALHATRGATLGEVGGQAVALSFGDFADEVAAIESGLALLPLEACGVLLVQGPEALVFLNGLTTNDLNAVPVGGAQRTLLCANKGKILHDLVAVRFRDDGILIIAEPGEAGAVAGHLDHYHVREELQLGNVELVRVDLLGPRAEEALTGVGIPPGTVEGTFAGAPVPAPRLPLGAVPRFLALGGEGNAAALVEALLSTSPEARLVGLEAYDEVRIRAGVPRAGVDFSQQHLPAEAALYDRLSFDKGCYLGQETHARMHYRGHPNRKLVALEIPEAAAASMGAGDEIFRDDGPVGTLTSLARQSRGGMRRAIAMVRFQAIGEASHFSARPGAPADIAHSRLASDLPGAPG